MKSVRLHGGVVFSPPPPIYLENYNDLTTKMCTYMPQIVFFSNSKIIFIKIYFNK